MSSGFPPSDILPLPRDASAVSPAEDESEWEYEYYDTETEDFYVTIDFTSQVPPAQRRLIMRGISSPNPTDETPQTAATPSSSHDGATPDAETPREDLDPQALPGATETQETTTREPSQRWMQIQGLSSANPLISLQNNLYSCHWATALGTDLLFTTTPQPNNTDPETPPSPPKSETTHAPLRSTPDYTLVGATAFRLIAKPAQLVRGPKPAPSIPQQGANPTPQPYRSAIKEAQVSFLTRLAALKAQRGDRDEVPHYTNRRDGGGADAASAMKEQDVASSEDDEGEANLSGIGMPDLTPSITPIDSEVGTGSRGRGRGAGSRARRGSRGGRGRGSRGSRSATSGGRRGRARAAAVSGLFSEGA